MKRGQSRKRKKTAPPAVVPKAMLGAVARRASIFRNGSNQAVRLPQELRFSDKVKEVRIRKLADGLLLSPVKPDWLSFFALEVEVPDDFLADRRDPPPQSRDLL
jgi:antitoxin VapB